VFVKNPLTAKDSYALISMGNLWLQMLHQPDRNKGLDKNHLQLAHKYYVKVLKSDPKNIWAANGIG